MVRRRYRRHASDASLAVVETRQFSSGVDALIYRSAEK